MFYKYLKYTLLLLAYSQLGLSQRNYFSVESMDDLKTLQSLSAESKKGMMLFICTSSLNECKRFSNQLSNREMVSYLSNYFLLAEVEGNSGIGRYLIDQYQIVIYPSLLWFAPNTYAMQLNEGLLSDEQIKLKALSAATRITSFDQFQESFSYKQLSTNGKKAYLEIVELNRMDSLRQELGESLLYDLFPNLSSDTSSFDVFFNYGLNLELPFIPYILNNPSHFKNQNPKFPINLAIEEAYAQNLQEAILSRDTALLEYIENHLCTFQNPGLELPSANKTRLLFQMENQEWIRARKSLFHWHDALDSNEKQTVVFVDLEIWKTNYGKDTSAIKVFYDFLSTDVHPDKKNEFKKQFLLAEYSLILDEVTECKDHIELAEAMAITLEDRVKIQAIKRRLISKIKGKSETDAFFTD